MDAQQKTLNLLAIKDSLDLNVADLSDLYTCPVEWNALLQK